MDTAALIMFQNKTLLSLTDKKKKKAEKEKNRKEELLISEWTTEVGSIEGTRNTEASSPLPQA